ncbi:MAG TPA: PfkB family carbohydrate kinase [Candidatus Limnocylindrales bacterium]|nr:PfkB family carbohydrate kinase [Candidatus Limnocylindrales bacterium]
MPVSTPRPGGPDGGPGAAEAPPPQAVVLGRVGADLYPLQLETPLEAVRAFARFVGGFAGNVATGLARLGVSTAIISAVGDDGHGRFVRNFLASEGVDVRWLSTHPSLRTALAFCEAWPPDHFPITFYRTPTCPDWELRPESMPLGAIGAARLLYVTGTGLAREPSRAATMAAMAAGPDAGRGPDRLHGGAGGVVGILLDLDWRQQLWPSADEYAAAVAAAVALADVVVGGAAEFEAAGLTPAEVLRRGPRVAVVKRGADGATLLSAAGERHVAGLPVPVTNGLGAGDAFAAAFGAALLEGRHPEEAVRRGNAAGAVVATRLSCSLATPTRDELEALLAGGSVRDGVVHDTAGRALAPASTEAVAGAVGGGGTPRATP